MAEPAYSFCIPSIEDDTPLDCRIYHPENLDKILREEKHGVKGAIIAHPYVPLGGSYDDPVVLSITETLLSQGFVVGTFNFRGAGDSSGRTTWSGKAEQEDYASFAGFISYYLQSLNSDESSNRLEPIPSASDQLWNSATSPTPRSSHGNVYLLLAGYSYGALILARLRPISTIIERLASAAIGTAGAEIILRAHTLAKQTKQSLDHVSSPSSPRGRQLLPSHATTASSPTKQRIGASPITVGGEETDPSTRRRSRDSRRSMDFVRKSVELPHRIKAFMKGSSAPKAARVSASEQQSETPTSPTSTAGHGPAVVARYLVISPVLLPFTQTLCPPGPLSMASGPRRGHTSADANAGAMFLQYPTLVIFGSSDGFTSSRRLKAWAQKVSRESKSSSFEWKEIEGAGHFWREAGVMQDLQRRIAA